MKFDLLYRDSGSQARYGKITTGHGVIQTPVFIPVGTTGSVKGIHQRELDKDIGSDIILGNTYHLYLRPGIETIRLAGGLHRFMNWDKSILTDSGGYQVFSLAEQRKLTEEGASFHSHIDGSVHLFTPENIVDMQRNIGADLIMAFDECTPFPCEYDYARNSMELTNRWLERGVRRFRDTEPLYGFDQSYLPIVQGSVFEDLRVRAAEYIAGLDLEGNAIGGLSVGEPEEDMYSMIEVVNAVLPPEKPRYLMGVGTPVNILESVSLGIDMFDCVIPTRNGRNGMLFTSEGTINIKNEKWKNDFTTLDSDGYCYVDQQYTKAYLRHLIVSGEMLGAQIASLHNLCFYQWLMKECRNHIQSGTFSSWKSAMMKKLSTRL